MQKIMKIGLTITFTFMAFCFVFVPLAQAQCLTPGQAGNYLPNTQKAVSKPIWQITQEGTAMSIQWSDYAANSRFSIYDSGTPGDESDDLVLDKETGLVWMRTPDTGGMGWSNAVELCYNKGAGRRRGWRLPSIEELASLIDPQKTTPPTLPDGHPFNVQPSYYWSSTTYESDNLKAWLVNMNDGVLGPLYKSTSNPVLCVRGGQGHDGW
jgi:hypothetical protein